MPDEPSMSELVRGFVDAGLGLDYHQLRFGRTDQSWIGDAGDSGGHVFVLETEPWCRIGHLHAVDLDGPQWRNYLKFRDLLRGNAEARRRYEEVKVRLAEQLPDDRRGYTSGKTDIVGELLARS